MKFTSFIAFATLVCSAVVAVPTSNDVQLAAVQQIFKVRTLVDDLYMAQNQGLAHQSVDANKLEQTLFSLAKTLDYATLTVKAVGSFDSHSAGAIMNYVQGMQVDVQNVTQELIAAKKYIVQLGLGDLIPVTLQTLVPGFDKLYRALDGKLKASTRKVVAALFISIICDMDTTAEYYKPGVKLTGEQYCTTYSPTGKPDLNNCPDKPWPTLPKVPQSYQDCDQSCGSVLKFAYQNSCWSQQTETKWCAPTTKVPVWSACTANWQPKQWVCNAVSTSLN
jgi:hypothetical protein